MPLPADWLLTAQRAAIHLPTATAVIADVHLGYDQVRRAAGDAVPLRGLDDSVASLSVLQRTHGVHRLVVAGDLFERATCNESLAGWLRWLGEAGWELVGVVPGNHDRGVPANCLPLFPDGIQLGEWRVVHGDGDLPNGPVVFGHYHPCLRWAGVRAPCYLATATRLILPAFSPDAAGVNVVGDPRWTKFLCYAISGRSVIECGLVGELAPPKRLAADRRSARAAPGRRRFPRGSSIRR
jgi:putative SbcD/Mre11-related phosphoesterase